MAYQRQKERLGQTGGNYPGDMNTQSESLSIYVSAKDRTSTDLMPQDIMDPFSASQIDRAFMARWTSGPAQSPRPSFICPETPWWLAPVIHYLASPYTDDILIAPTATIDVPRRKAPLASPRADEAPREVGQAPPQRGHRQIRTMSRTCALWTQR